MAPRKEVMASPRPPHEVPESGNLLTGAPIPPRDDPTDDATHPPAVPPKRRTDAYRRIEGPKSSSNTTTVLVVLVGLALLLAFAWRQAKPADTPSPDVGSDKSEP